jgi:hypothetical protein
VQSANEHATWWRRLGPREAVGVEPPIARSTMRRMGLVAQKPRQITMPFPSRVVRSQVALRPAW